MGVPKFFRWMSERYPGISQLIAENRIPEFDCLYVGSLAQSTYMALTMNHSST
jgi:5'-3' exonuclease